MECAGLSVRHGCGTPSDKAHMPVAMCLVWMQSYVLCLMQLCNAGPMPCEIQLHLQEIRILHATLSLISNAPIARHFQLRAAGRGTRNGATTAL